jgi:hypothetical protein
MITAAERTQNRLSYVCQRIQKHQDALGWAERSHDTVRAERLRGWLATLETQRATLAEAAAEQTVTDATPAVVALPTASGWRDRTPADVAEILVRSIATLTRQSVRGSHREQVTAIATAAAVALVEHHDEQEARRVERRRGDLDEQSETP